MSEQFDSVKYNNFHEWEEDNEELFEVREIIQLPPTPDVSDSETDEHQPSTRGTKFRNVLNLMTGKKSTKKGDRLRNEPNKHSTLPRIHKEERDIYIRHLRDEVFGLGKFYKEPSLYESDDPRPFVYTFPSGTKTVRWHSDPSRTTTVKNVVFDEKNGDHQITVEQEAGSASEQTNPRKRGNPFWEEEFELPEPELVYNPNNPVEHGSQSGCIPIDLSDVLHINFCDDNSAAMSTLPLNVNKTIVNDNKDPDLRQYPELMCNCGDPSCNASCVHILKVEGIRANLGQDIADLIVTEMILRLGPPLPLPRRNVNESSKKILALREKAVVQGYANWASTFVFQKLIVAIKLSLDKFQPSHRGILNLEFKVWRFYSHELTSQGLSDFSRC